MGHEIQREVERADRADDTDGHSQREPELADAGVVRSIATISPVRVRASTAEKRNVPTDRVASTRAVVIGLAASPAIDRAKSSWRGRDPVGGRVEDRRPLVGGERRACRLLGGGDCRIDVFRGPDCDVTQLTAVEGGPDRGVLVGGDAVGADAERVEFSHPGRIGGACCPSASKGIDECGREERSIRVESEVFRLGGELQVEVGRTVEVLGNAEDRGGP